MANERACHRRGSNSPSFAWLGRCLLLGLAACWLFPTGLLSEEAGKGDDTKQSASPGDQPEPPTEEEDPKEDDSESSMSRHDALLAALTIFILAIFVGFEVITKVPPTLHTPLMSGSNAISGITLVGAVIVAGKAFGFSTFLGMIAVVLASINVLGGFLVTHRMLAMFKSRK